MSIAYVNMDPSLVKKGGRNAVKITKDELLKKLYVMHAKSQEWTTSIYGVGINVNNFSDSNVSDYAISENSTIMKDLSKIWFDFENFEAEHEPNTLIGMNTLSNGLTFCGCIAGGDWEEPVFFIIYCDGKSLRAYIPVHGNCINLDFKTAFGSEKYTDVDINALINLPRYKALPPYKVIRLNNERVWMADSELLTEIYKKHQGIDSVEDDLDFNWDAIQLDIESRIIVR